MGKMVLANLVLLAILTAFGKPHYYLMFWILPLLTWQQVVTRIRNIAEHAMVPDNNDPMRNARTTYAKWWERAMFAPYWVNYHVDHHLLFYVPCYNLPKLHRMLLAKGLGPKMEIQQELCRHAEAGDLQAGAAAAGCMSDPAAFIRANTELMPPPLVPEIAPASGDRGRALVAQDRGRTRSRRAFPRPSGPLPGPADRRWRAMCSTIPTRYAANRVLDFGAGSGMIGHGGDEGRRGTVCCAPTSTNSRSPRSP